MPAAKNNPRHNDINLPDYLDFLSKSLHLKYFERFYKDKVLPFNKVVQISQRLREQGKRVMFTSGCYDIIHMGHIMYFHYLRERADVMIVGVDSNKSVAMLKGRDRPYIDEMERAAIVSSFAFVDYTFILSGPWTTGTLHKLKPTLLGIPTFDPNMADKLEKCQICGIEPVITPPYLRANTTSKLSRDLYNEYLKTRAIKC